MQYGVSFARLLTPPCIYISIEVIKRLVHSAGHFIIFTGNEGNHLNTGSLRSLYA